jgi:hypothetical protein
MTSNWSKTILHFFSFVLFIWLELWIFAEAYQLHTTGTVSDYTSDQLFWLFIMIMITPVLPQITFYTKNKIGVAVLHIVVVVAIAFLLSLKSSFIPALPLLTVYGILLYTYAATGLQYLQHRDNLAKQTQTEIAYTTFRIIAFFIAFYAGTYFGNQASFSANYLLYILITIPLFIFFAVLIFVNDAKVTLNQPAARR